MGGGVSTSLKIESWIGAHLPPPIARIVRRIGVYPRYWLQMRACRSGFREFGHLYPQQVLFIAGLPKSGTTWLTNMVSSYPGFYDLLIPEQTAYDLKTGGSHDYDLPVDLFSQFERMLVVTKMHVHGSPHNVRVLNKAGVRYVVLYRDLRDVAVSEVHYLQCSRWHPEYPYYAGLSMFEGLEVFARRTLPAYINWVHSWCMNRDHEMSLELRYEDMLSDPIAAMTRIAEHFELDGSSERIKQIVEAHSFQNLSGGRNRGQESKSSFFRKGTSGDWRNYFTYELREIYKQHLGSFLVEFDYEQDSSWC
jgi:hypothetical protein